MGILAGLGIDLITNMVSGYGEELVTKGIEKVTGVKLDKKPSEEQIQAIRAKAEVIAKEVDAMYADKRDARAAAIKLGNSESWLRRSAGPIIGLAIIFGTLAIYALILSGYLDAETGSVSLVLGGLTAMASSVSSFYFGSSRNG